MAKGEGEGEDEGNGKNGEVTVTTPAKTIKNNGLEIEECDSCRIDFGANIMIHVCDTVECIADRINCQELIKDFNNGKITGENIIKKVYEAARQTGEQEIISFVGNIYDKIINGDKSTGEK